MAFIEIHEPGDPTLVMLHGTGGDEQGMLEFGKRLSKRTGYLALRGKEPEGSVNRWFRRFGEGVFDEPNLKMRAEELADYVMARLPNERRVAVGFSNGANIAAAALLLRPEAFDAAVLLAPMVPFSPDSLPDLSGKPILMVCGEQDPIVPMANAQTLATMFEASGAALDLHWHPGGHGLSATEMNVASAWLAKLFTTG
ncbi:MAG: alpha/beta hydrolase [Fimbriimonas sp.]